MGINYKDIEEYCRQDVIYTYNLEINYFLIMRELPYNEFGFITDLDTVNEVINLFKEDESNNKDFLWYLLNNYTYGSVLKDYYNVIDTYINDFFIETNLIKITFNVQLKDYYFKYYDWYTDSIHHYDVEDIYKNISKLRSVSIPIEGSDKEVLIYNIQLETKEPICL